MKIVALVSSYREGPLLEAAIRSVAMLDHVLVAEGPVDENRRAFGEESVIPKDLQRLSVIRGEWPADAAKRTAMVQWMQARRWMQDEEIWGLWLDGDEVLLWGEYLRDWINRVVEESDDPDNPVAGFPFTLVEFDGTVVWCMGKLVRIDLVERYLISSSYVEFKGGYTKTIGNVTAWTPLDGPLHMVDLPDGSKVPHWRARPPLQGEPHLQHRPMLRSLRRQVERQHLAEARNFDGVDLDNPTAPSHPESS